MTAMDAFLLEYQRINRLVRHLDANLMDAFGLPAISAVTLVAIADGADRPHLAAERLGASTSTTGRVIDRLERHGLIERVPRVDLADRRAVGLRLTELGAETAPKVRETLERLAAGLVGRVAA